MKRTDKLYFDRKVARIFTGIFLMICTINQVNAEVSQLSPINQDDFENVLNRYSTQFYESERPKNLLDDFFRYICSVKFFRKISKKFLFSTKYNTLLYDVFEEKKYYIFPFLSYFYSLYLST